MFSLHPSILIAGVGNVLLTDDGVGVHAAQALQRKPLTGVTVVDLGTAILHGLPFLEAADRVLVIDAAQGGRPPGTLYLFEATDPVETKAMFSIHAMGLREALRLLPPGVARPRITVLGVEPESLAYGMNLSPRVQAVLPSVVELARQTVEHWLAAATPPAICERELQPDKLDDCYAKLSQ